MGLRGAWVGQNPMLGPDFEELREPRTGRLEGELGDDLPLGAAEVAREDRTAAVLHQEPDRG